MAHASAAPAAEACAMRDGSNLMTSRLLIFLSRFRGVFYVVVAVQSTKIFVFFTGVARGSKGVSVCWH